MSSVGLFLFIALIDYAPLQAWPYIEVGRVNLYHSVSIDEH
jgi:hypothetical protein